MEEERRTARCRKRRLIYNNDRHDSGCACREQTR